ncbi:hypothetical protein PUV54_10085 [Hyphococcus flavus]|uniref:Uncharacterized protein n=1 Tax=Hyphococcus flavus TaxID=1866326 RepID=A0AAE9ZG97_9PROT|nr:hypothetical protein [Hyphococcus flavus]WDI30306.1 hypothetical protein PUV54_10085 [Hyphococcus flavus]
MKFFLSLFVLFLLLACLPVIIIDHESNMRRCTANNLQPIEDVWTLENKSLTEIIDDKTEDYRGDTLAYFGIIFFKDNSIIAVDESMGDITQEQRDKIVMYIFKRAAEQGSAIAKAEIGASLIFCYQDVKQDTISGLKWLLHPMIKLDRKAWSSGLNAYDKILTEFIDGLMRPVGR